MGETLIFRSSENTIDSLVISGIDSAINDEEGYFINSRNSKNITASYKQIPVDKLQDCWYEGGEMKKYCSYRILISVDKYPDNLSTEVYCNFKQFRYSNSVFPRLNTDTIMVNNRIVTNYYKIEKHASGNEDFIGIKVCFFTKEEGLIAFNSFLRSCLDEAKFSTKNLFLSKYLGA